jgi:hypothetical protein
MLVFPYSLYVSAALEKMSISKVPKATKIKLEFKFAAVSEASLFFNLMLQHVYAFVLLWA